MMVTENNELPVPEEQVNASGIEDTTDTAPTAEPAVEKESKNRQDAPADPQGPAPENAADPVVDFSDEEAALAADAPEFDLGDEEPAEENAGGDRVSETVDYSGKNKEQLLAIFETLLRTKPVQTIRADVEAIKIAFYKNYRNEVDQLRKLFVESGGNSEDFVPPANEAEQQFKTLFAEYREKRNEFIARLDAEKEANYQTKLQIIEELKELVNSNETLNQTFNTFRELQQRWKETGLVQQSVMKDLWETYNLHVENFYNFIKINKELRDLDLKKNYEAKIALCEEAEALVLENSVITAFHKLQKLHEQWREIGPVTNEYKEQLFPRSQFENQQTASGTFRPTERGTKEKPRPENRALRQDRGTGHRCADLPQGVEQSLGTTDRNPESMENDRFRPEKRQHQNLRTLPQRMR